jgi:signal transduction histidine kinase
MLKNQKKTQNIDVGEKIDYTNVEQRTGIISSLLNLFLHTSNKREFLNQSLDILMDWLGLTYGGIRVTDDTGNIPYEASRGFDQEFIQSEKWLSLNNDICVCIRVIRGDIESQDKSQITASGSFCCNDTSKFGEKLSDTEKARFRGMCIQRGFKSVAVIPIHYGEKILGAIHLVDERKNRFDRSTIEFVEYSIAPIIGEGVYRFSVEERLQYNLKSQTAIASLLKLSLEELALEEVLNLALDIFSSSGLFPSHISSCIYLSADKPEEFILKAVRDKEDKPKGKCSCFFVNEGILGQAASKKIALFSDQYTPECEKSGLPVDSVSCYCIPIIFGKATLGLLVIFLETQHRKEQKEEDFLVAFANALAGIIWRKYSDDKLRMLSRRLVGVQEEERRAIALELHDQIGQMLTGLKLMLTQASRSSGENQQKILDESQKTLSELMVKVREMSLNLRPSMMDDLGLLPAFLWQFQQYHTKANINVDFKHSGLDRQFPKDVSIAAYRIVQEALTNIMKHAKVRDVSVNTWVDDNYLHIMIEDKGVGFVPESVSNGSSVGLHGMRERAFLLGGTLAIESSPGAGTRISAVLPINDKVESGKSTINRNS